MKKNNLSLDEIGLKYGTDKSSSWHNYLKYYDKIFKEHREEKIKLFEIGIWGGASLLTWKEYFQNGEIIGLDIDDKKELEQDRIFTFKGDQSNTSDLDKVNELYGDFDIILDDGSHKGLHQLISFNHLFPLLKKGGYYVIEDCLCAYNTTWNLEINILDRIKQMVGDVNMNGLISNDRICANKDEAINLYDGNYFEKNIEYIFISCGTAIIKKIK